MYIHTPPLYNVHLFCIAKGISIDFIEQFKQKNVVNWEFNNKVLVFSFPLCRGIPHEIKVLSAAGKKIVTHTNKNQHHSNCFFFDDSSSS